MNRFRAFARLEAPGWLVAVTLALFCGTVAICADTFSRLN